MLVLLVNPAHAQTPSPGSAEDEALRLLRQTIAEQTRNPEKIIRSPTNEVPVAKPRAPRSPLDAAADELEQRYLAGKLSQREYEKSLARLRLSSPVTNSTGRTSTTATSPKASTGTPAPIQPAIAAPAPQPTERQKKISEVESRLDDMIRSKEARERALTNKTTTVPGQKLTKRERLDFLLLQVVQGKLSDEEYKKERERILAEPD